MQILINLHWFCKTESILKQLLFRTTRAEKTTLNCFCLLLQDQFYGL